MGAERGNITLKELNQALTEYRNGKIDGIVVVVSGQTKVRDEILQAVRSGEVEAAFSVDVWNEGADLPMFTHQLGLRSTFSRYREGQERGRVNRREKDDVSLAGELKNDEPKILFDSVDRYNSFDRALVRYADVMGVPGAARAPFGELFDAVHGEVVGEVDRKGRLNGQFKPVEDNPESKPEPVRKPEVGNMDNVTAQLWKILETKYNNDTAEMALDLGIAEADLKDLLEGKGWIKARWFLRRMATLLYETRDALVSVYNEDRGQIDEKVSAEDMNLLRAGVAVYEQWEGHSIVGATIAGDLGFGMEQVKVNEHQYGNLRKNITTDMQWRNMWRGLRIYFSNEAQKLDHQMEAQVWVARLDQYLWQRRAWQRVAGSATTVLLNTVRQRVAERLGGKLPTALEGLPLQDSESHLVRFIDQGFIVKDKNFVRRFYSDLRILMTQHLGLSEEYTNKLILANIFEENKWSTTATTARDKLLLAVRRGVARYFGERLPFTLEDLPGQGENAALSKFIDKNEIQWNRVCTPAQFYHDLRVLMTRHLSMDTEVVDNLIIRAVFEENKWPVIANTAVERLLFAVRRNVVLVFGGKPPIRLDGLPEMRPSFPLMKFIQEGLLESRFATRFSVDLRKLMISYLDFSPESADGLIVAAVFEENKWTTTANTAAEQLLLAVRQGVAQRFFGNLPKEPANLPAQGPRAALTHFVEQGTMTKYSDHLKLLYQDIFILMAEHLGFSAESAEALIDAAREESE